MPQPTTTTTMHTNIQHQNLLSGMGHEQILAAPSVLQDTRRQLIALKRALAAPSVTSVSATATMMSSVVGGIKQGSLVVGAGQRPSFGNARTAEAAARILDLAIAMSAMFHATVI